MSNRSRKMVNLACNGRQKSDTVTTNDSDCKPGTNNGSSIAKEKGSSPLRTDNDVNYSSDLDETQMDVVNEMENYLNMSDLLSPGPSTSKSKTLDVEALRELDNDEALFGTDYSDLDPDYSANTIKNSSGSDSPPNVDQGYSESEKENSNYELAILIMENILERVWLSVRPLKRRRKANPADWKRNINKSRRAEGLEYTSHGKVQPAKVPKPVNCEKCKFKCTTLFSEEERNTLCRNYYNLDYVSKKNYILSCVTVQEIKTRRVQRTSEKKARSFSKKCFFSKDSEKYQVCQKFFTTTLCISVDVISDAVAKSDSLGIYKSEDQRGKKEPPNKTEEGDVNFVREHIESFPIMDSHYCRKDSKKIYLSADVKSISNMYRLYKEKCEELDRTAVSENKYRSVFCNEFNISFFKPKKDLCNICCTYVKASDQAKVLLQSEYDDHINRKNISSRAKDEDKKRANTDTSFMSITVDLQAVLQIPSGGESLLYYMRKLVLYNFTIYEARLPNVAHCLCWSEINGKKGSCEIGTCLHHYLLTGLPSNVKHLTIFSDTCGGQNRNKYISAFLLWIVQKHEQLDIIEQKFLESGHTYMEVDSMHAAIENASKNVSINSVSDWKNIFKLARRKQIKTIKTDDEEKTKIVVDNYKVKEFKFNEMMDLKKLAATLLKNTNKDNTNEKVNWLKIKRIKYVKGEKSKIFFNYDLSDDLRFIDVTSSNKTANTPKTRLRTHSNPPSVANIEFPAELESLYDKPLPISAAKKKDLETMCKKGIIPEEFHPWIRNLKTVKDNQQNSSDNSDFE